MLLKKWGMNQMAGIQVNKREIRLVILIIIVLISIFSIYLFKKNSLAEKHREIAVNVYSIINSDDTSQMIYLKEALVIKPEHHLLESAQYSIVCFFTKYQKTDFVDTIINYYRNTESKDSRHLVLVSFADLVTPTGVDFLIEELNNTQDDMIRKIIISSLYEIYFQEEKITGNIKDRIVQAINIETNNDEILIKKYIILTLAGEEDYTKELYKLITKSEANKKILELSLYRNNDKKAEMIKQNEGLLNMLKDIAKDAKLNLLVLDYL